MIKKLIFLEVLLIMVFSFSGCVSSHGIPNGTYHSCDENGKVTRQAPEDAWQIKNNEAEYRYNKYEILEENGKIFFDHPSTETSSGYRYEIKYDNSTKILTVYLPLEDGITAFLFKK